MKRLPGVADSRAEGDERREAGAAEMPAEAANEDELRSDLTTQADFSSRIRFSANALEFFRENVRY